MGCSTLGVADFMRVPSPAARTMTAAGREVVTRVGSRRSTSEADSAPRVPGRAAAAMLPAGHARFTGTVPAGARPPPAGRARGAGRVGGGRGGGGRARREGGTHQQTPLVSLLSFLP